MKMSANDSRGLFKCTTPSIYCSRVCEGGVGKGEGDWGWTESSRWLQG